MADNKIFDSHISIYHILLYSTVRGKIFKTGPWGVWMLWRLFELQGFRSPIFVSLIRPECCCYPTPGRLEMDERMLRSESILSLEKHLRLPPMHSTAPWSWLESSSRSWSNSVFIWFVWWKSNPLKQAYYLFGWGGRWTYSDVSLVGPMLLASLRPWELWTHWSSWKALIAVILNSVRCTSPTLASCRPIMQAVWSYFWHTASRLVQQIIYIVWCFITKI